LAYQISHYYSLGKRAFVISSSGNAAISAGNIIKTIPDANLEIFISKNIDEKKLNKLMYLNSKRIKINQGFKPKSDAILFAKKNDFINLRASTDTNALIGYKTISYELESEARSSDGIFIPVSSGTAALGIALGFEDLGIKIPIYLCQTTKINSIASEFDMDFYDTETSLADAIVDRVAIRKNELIRVVNDTHGDAFVISDELLFIAKEKMLRNGKDFSFNSLLGLAGLLKAKSQGKKINNPIILASGL
jgi:threonine synthase